MSAIQHLVAPDRAWDPVARYSARHMALALSCRQREFVMFGGDRLFDCSYSVLATPRAFLCTRGTRLAALVGAARVNTCDLARPVAWSA